MSKHPLTTQTGFQELLKEVRFNPETPLADKAEIMAHLFLEQAIAAMVDMSAKDAMIGFGISVEKMQLLRGLPTEIKASIPILIQIAERLAEAEIPLTTGLTKYLEAINEQR